MKAIKTMKIGKVLETTLYNFFNLLILAVPYSEFSKEDGILQFDNTNRETNEQHIKKMSFSLKLLGLLRCPVVIFNESLGKYLILDGQHLIKGSILNKIPVVYCIVYQGKEKSKAMSTLNNTQKPWGLLQFIKHFAKQTKKNDYQTLLDAMKGSKVKSSVLPMIFTNKSRGEAKKDVVSGNFKIVNKNANEIIKNVGKCYDCNDTLPKTRQYQEKLVLLMLNTKNFNIIQFTKNLCTIKVENFGNDEAKIAEQLANIYSSKLRQAA